MIFVPKKLKSLFQTISILCKDDDDTHYNQTKVKVGFRAFVDENIHGSEIKTAHHNAISSLRFRDDMTQDDIQDLVINMLDHITKSGVKIPRNCAGITDTDRVELTTKRIIHRIENPSRLQNLLLENTERHHS